MAKKSKRLHEVYLVVVNEKVKDYSYTLGDAGDIADWWRKCLPESEIKVVKTDISGAQKWPR